MADNGFLGVLKLKKTFLYSINSVCLYLSNHWTNMDLYYNVASNKGLVAGSGLSNPPKIPK